MFSNLESLLDPKLTCNKAVENIVESRDNLWGVMKGEKCEIHLMMKSYI